MINIVSMLYLQTKRRLLSQAHEKRFPILLSMILLLFVVIQMEWIANAEEWDITLIGWVMAGVLLAFTCFGLFSNRIPGQMEDVIWLYTAPYPLYMMIYSVWIWNMTWKSLLWLCSGILADLFLLLFRQQDPQLTVKALQFVLFIIVLEAWVLALSSARNLKNLKLILTVTLLCSLVVYGLTFYYYFLTQNHSLWWDVLGRKIGEIGYVIKGNYSLTAYLVLTVFLALSFIIIRFTANRLECKEKLVKEAEFWSEFREQQIGIGQLKEKQTWWGMKTLNGIFSFLWMDILLVKKNLFFHTSHFLALLLIFYYLISVNLDWFYIFFTMIVLTAFLSSYYSSLIRHAKSGDLFLFPGSLWKKAILLEMGNTLWMFFLFVFSLGICQLIVFIPKGEMLLLFIYGLGSYVLMLAIRWAVFVQTYALNPKLPFALYYKVFILTSVVSFLFVFILHKAAQHGPALLLPILFILSGGWIWFLFWRYKSRIRFVYLWVGTFLFPILVFLISGIG
ncbi:sporulation killing factor system integral membrane protein [Bacillus sp. CLL-7-23]|uniref:Sporulation killing factor system integral membrane protein n=1 Tax=Bacillus changyiensis TaxID=3004103 RepID=A0ABT4X4R9_9BACI|nr:sporulation killing factor system integral membrane protein [Bacillus changyiensis]MDA7026362.1 sporulation killing factor system integral membrane protein [Bacillus changyiensis]